MPMGDFVKEHKRLINILGSHVKNTKTIEKEKKRQQKELERILRMYKK